MLWRLDPAERVLARPQGEEWWTCDEPLDQINGGMALSVVHWELDRRGLAWSERDLADTERQAAFNSDSWVVVLHPMCPGLSVFGLELVAYEAVSGKRLWRAQELRKIKGHLFLLLFAPDGSALLGPMQGGDVLVYRVEDGALLQQLPTHLGEPVQALAFDHNGRTHGDAGVRGAAMNGRGGVRGMEVRNFSLAFVRAGWLI